MSVAQTALNFNKYLQILFFSFNTQLALIQHNVPGLSLKRNNYTKNLFIRFTTTLHVKFLKEP